MQTPPDITPAALQSHPRPYAPQKRQGFGLVAWGYGIDIDFRSALQILFDPLGCQTKASRLFLALDFGP
jgi:hypothetical protein